MAAAMAAAAKPPVARRAPVNVRFGAVAGENRGPNPMDPPRTRVDPYFWIRDDERQQPEVLDLLRAENAYTEAKTAHLAAARAELYEEMLSHVAEDDDTVPFRQGEHVYWSRTVKGLSYRQFLRRAFVETDELWTATEGGAVYLDVNEVAKTLPDPTQCDVGEVEPSPDGKTLAFTLDGTGYETYDIRIRSLEAPGAADEVLKDTGGSVCWGDDATLFYVKQDASHRPFQVWRHALGSAQAADVLVFEDLDEVFCVACARERDGSLVLIASESKETSEVYFVQSSALTAPPTLVRPRVTGVKMDVASHAPSRSLLITSNADGAANRALHAASLDAPAVWRPLATSPVASADAAAVLPHSTTRSLYAPEVFRDFVVVPGREDGFTQIWVAELETHGGELRAKAAEHRVQFSAESFTADLGANALFDAEKLRVVYSDMTSPRSTLEYSVADRKFGETPLKVQPVPHYDKTLYETRRVQVPSRDGETLVPLTLLWRTDCRDEGTPMPVHLYGYGSYGISMDPSFSATRLPLVDRGVCYAIAHVRGGAEMGHNLWYEQQGKYLLKQNTFSDFVDCADHLVETRVAAQGAISIEGRSAGGLLVGNAVNLKPERFAACLAGVPFVDLMVTMCDPSIPLTTEEWEEWGNPNQEKFFDYMLEYSPIDQVRQGLTYPKMLLVSGLNDPRVAYWEPAKWAQVLRSKIQNPDDVCLKMDMAAGHFSANDRYRYLKELAFDYAWLIEQLPGTVLKK